MRPPSLAHALFLGLPVAHSRRHVEELGGFIGVIDGQADGSDVLQSLHNNKKESE